MRRPVSTSLGLGGSGVVTSGLKDALRRRARRPSSAILDPGRAAALGAPVAGAKERPLQPQPGTLSGSDDADRAGRAVWGLGLGVVGGAARVVGQAGDGSPQDHVAGPAEHHPRPLPEAWVTGQTPAATASRPWPGKRSPTSPSSARIRAAQRQPAHGKIMTIVPSGRPATTRSMRADDLAISPMVSASASPARPVGAAPGRGSSSVGDLRPR